MANEKEQLKEKVENLSALSIPADRKEEMISSITRRKLDIFKLLVPAGALGVLAFLLVSAAGPRISTTPAAGLTENDFQAAETRITTVEQDISDDFSADEAEFEAVESDLETLDI